MNGQTELSSRILAHVRSFYVPEQYPALIAQAEEWRHSQPFAGRKLLDVTPIFRNTMAKYWALLEGGAELSLAVGRMMPHDPDVVTLLRNWGIHVYSDSLPAQKQFDVILDCAGSFADSPVKYGFVELTRTGAGRFRSCAKPVFLADASRIKEIETCLGTGNGLFRALDFLNIPCLPNAKLVLFGYGKVGRGIAMYAQERQLQVTVVDLKEPAGELPENVNFLTLKERSRLEEVLRQADFVVTATGVRNALAGAFDPEILLDGHAVLANMGVEDEYGSAIPVDRVLNQKKPLNFVLEEPTLLEYIETTMALHNAGALSILQGNCKAGLNPVPYELEQHLLAVSVAGGKLGPAMKKAGIYDYEQCVNPER